MIIGTNCHGVIQTLGVSILWAGPGHHTVRRAISQFCSFSLWRAPPYMSLYTPSTHTCFLGCELDGIHKWATWFPAAKLHRVYTWATRGEQHALSTKQDNLHIHAFCQLVAPVALMHVFPGMRWYIFIQFFVCSVVIILRYISMRHW